MRPPELKVSAEKMPSRVGKGNRFCVSRRVVCALVAGFSTEALLRGSALAKPGAEASQVTLPISVFAAEEDGKAVVDRPWLDGQLKEANRVIGAHSVGFEFSSVVTATEVLARLETRADRDTLGAVVAPKVINVFVVASLRDVDDTERFRMGVHWRRLTNLNNNYVIVAASARRATLAHEIGHYLGNPHTSVENNLMSYKRSDEEAVFMDATQGARCRATAAAHLATGKLVQVPVNREAT